MASYILEEKEKPDCKFRKYIDLLPDNFDEFPIFYSDQEVSYLEGSPLITYIGLLRRAMKGDYEFIC
jgi:hypothetical protein